MKKFFIGLIVFCSISVSASAVVVNSQNSQTPVQQLNILPFNQYLEFYSIDKNNINMYFIALPDEQDRKFIKTLNDTEKENYKYVKKVQKLISKGNWGEVLYKYPNYFPAYVQYYNYCMSKKNYREALRMLVQIQNMDKYGQVFKQDIVNYAFGTLYYNTGNFTKALEYFKAYENIGTDCIYSSIANCYFYLGQYQKAIDYKKKMKTPAYIDKELIYDAYVKLNDTKSANELAKELLKEKYGYTNLLRLVNTSLTEDQKIVYAYTARNTASTDSQISEINNIIANLEQARIDSKISKLTQFVKVPKWSDLKKQFPPNVTQNEITLKQDEYFSLANKYLEKYSGQNLTNAFNSLNQDFVNYIQTKKNEYYKEQELQAQAQMLLEQQRQNNYVRQQIIRQQRLRYYMVMDRMYYMGNPSYYMSPYDLWW